MTTTARSASDTNLPIAPAPTATLRNVIEPYDTTNARAVAVDDHGWLAEPYYLRTIVAGAPGELPCGIVDDQGGCHKRVRFTPMQGWEEDAAEHGDLGAVVVGCIRELGGVTYPARKERDKDQVKALTAAVDSLTHGDFTYLIFGIRRISFIGGDQYAFNVRCVNEACKHRTFTASLDLGDMWVKPKPQPTKRVFELTLPVSSQVVRFRLLTHSDAKRHEALAAQHKSAKVGPTTLSLFLSILTVGDKPLNSPLDLRDWYAADREVLFAAVKDAQGGVKVEDIVVNCPACGVPLATSLPVDASFFRPSVAIV